MVQSVAVEGDGSEDLESGETEEAVQLASGSIDSDERDSGESATTESAQSRHSPRTMLASSLRAHTARLRIARVRADFEQTLLTILTLNVIYMYYIDHKLLALLIRACQVIWLLHFPYASPASQRSTAALLVVSNLPVLLIHKNLFSGSGIANNIGTMLFINFIGPEPKNLTKMLAVELIIMTLQTILLQSKWEWEGMHFVSALPVPISDNFIRNAPVVEPSDASAHRIAEDNEIGSAIVT